MGIKPGHRGGRKMGPVDVETTFSRWIDDQMSAGVTINELADKCNCTVAALYSLRTGRTRAPKLPLASAIAKASKGTVSVDSWAIDRPRKYDRECPLCGALSAAPGRTPADWISITVADLYESHSEKWCPDCAAAYAEWRINRIKEKA